MSPIVTAEAAVSTWSMVVDATTSPLRPIAVDTDARGRVAYRFDAPGDVRGAGAAGGAGDGVALALARVVGDGGPPASTVMIVSADSGPERFGVLGEGAERAGLPLPTWVPDAVAAAGTVLAAGRTDGPWLVIDARADDIQAWGVRPSAAAGRVGPVEPLELAGRVENLLVGVVRGKLGASVPAPVALPSPRSAEPGLRAVAGLRSDVRDASRRLVAEGSDHGRTVVAVDGIEVTIDARELAEALGHAAREQLVATFGADGGGARAVVVAAGTRGLVRLLVAATDAALVPERPGAALDGAIALVRPRPWSGRHPSTTTPIAASVGTASGGTASATVDRGPTAVGTAHGDRPRWAVPVLSSLVVAALAASGAAVLTDVVSPREPAPAAVVPLDAGAPRHATPAAGDPVDGARAPTAVVPPMPSPVVARPVVAPSPRSGRGGAVSR